MNRAGSGIISSLTFKIVESVSDTKFTINSAWRGKKKKETDREREREGGRERERERERELHPLFSRRARPIANLLTVHYKSERGELLKGHSRGSQQIM